MTSNYFDVLGVRPIRGRNFLPEEEEGADVAMVTENFWRKRLGGDPNVIGRSITLDGIAHTIVGVLPNMPVCLGRSGCRSLDDQAVTDSRIHLRANDARHELSPRHWKDETRNDVEAGAGRVACARSELSHRISGQDRQRRSRTTLRTLPEDVSGNLRPAFATLFAAVAFVLLIACSNVANLLFVRFSGRRREIALRMAIGASRTGIVRLFVFREFAREFTRRSRRRLAGLAVGAARSENGGEFSSARSQHTRQPLFSRARLHDCIVDLDRAVDGNLSCTSKLARRSGGCGLRKAAAA